MDTDHAFVTDLSGVIGTVLGEAAIAADELLVVTAGRVNLDARHGF